jgi:hypothetical protein
MDESASGAPSDAAGASETGDLLYDAFYGGAIGGAVVALFFLAVDVVAGQPMYTPAMLGEVLFTGAEPADVTAVRLDMVAYFSGVHLVMFLVLGLAVSYLFKATGMSRRSLPVAAGTIFVILTGVFIAGDLLIMRGVATAIGIPLVLTANLLTALAMAAFLRRAHAGD